MQTLIEALKAQGDILQGWLVSYATGWMESEARRNKEKKYTSEDVYKLLEFLSNARREC